MASYGLQQTQLCYIADKYGTDKSEHGYTKYYHEHFKHLKERNINMLEIGIFKGASIKMWNEYFPNGQIYCIDNCIHNSSGNLLCTQDILNELNSYSSNIHAINCCQKDKIKINKIFKDIELDLIVDDGQHFQEHMLTSFGNLFKNVKSGGIYVIEDICTMQGFQTGSWWGQKHGVQYTNAVKEGGRNLWLEKFKKTGELESEETFSDSVWYVLHKYIKTGTFYSEYLTDDENKYLSDNIKNIEIIAAPSSRGDAFHNKFGIPKYPGTKDTKLKTGCIAIIYKL